MPESTLSSKSYLSYGMLTDANALKADIDRMEASAESEERALPSEVIHLKIENSSGLDLRAARIRMRGRILRYQTHRHGQRLGERTETRSRTDCLRCSGGGRGNVHEQSGLRGAGETERKTSGK